MDFFGPHLLAYFIATLHFLGTLAAIHAVLTVRTAQGSIAWALSLMFIPYLTLIPYLIDHRRKRICRPLRGDPRRRSRRQR